MGSAERYWASGGGGEEHANGPELGVRRGFWWMVRVKGAGRLYTWEGRRDSRLHRRRGEGEGRHSEGRSASRCPVLKACVKRALNKVIGRGFRSEEAFGEGLSTKSSSASSDSSCNGGKINLWKQDSKE